MLEQEATQIKSKLGKDYGSDAYVGKTRTNVAIYPITQEAYRETINDDKLAKAVFGNR